MSLRTGVVGAPHALLRKDLTVEARHPLPYIPGGCLPQWVAAVPALAPAMVLQCQVPWRWRCFKITIARYTEHVSASYAQSERPNPIRTR